MQYLNNLSINILRNTSLSFNQGNYFGKDNINIHMYFYFKHAVRAHMERTAQKNVLDIVYTMNLVTTSMEPVPTDVKMDT